MSTRANATPDPIVAHITNLNIASSERTHFIAHYRAAESIVDSLLYVARGVRRMLHFR
jgi:hypothetical protein